MLLESNDMRVSVLLVIPLASVVVVILSTSSTVPLTIQVILETGVETTMHVKDAFPPATPLDC